MSLDISVHLPFDEAIAWAKARDVVLPDDYYGNRIGIARAQAFSVAGLASLDQLDLVKQSLDKALASGVSFHDWKQQAARGDIPLDLPAHRLDNIFRTNLQGSYMAGHWQGVEETKLTHPYLMYDAVNDTRTRPTHKAMDNIIKPVDDAFWKANYPPNGYRCRCTVRKLTEKKAKALGGETANDAIPEHAKADTGWDYNVGLSRGAGIKQAVEQRIKQCETLNFSAKDKKRSLCSEKINDYLKMLGRAAVSSGEMPTQRKTSLPLSKATTETAFMNEFMTHFDDSVFLSVTGDNLAINSDLFTTKDKVWKWDKRERAQWLNYMALNIKEPDEVWLVQKGNYEEKLYLLSMFDIGSASSLSCIAVFSRDSENQYWGGVSSFATTDSDYLEKERLKSDFILKYYR